MKERHFEIKGKDPMPYYLGCDFSRDENGTLHFAPMKHIEKIENCYHSMFGSKPKKNLHVAAGEGRPP